MRADEPEAAYEPARQPERSPFDVLVCPLCGEPLAPAGASLRCAARHTFDIARQGYVGLLTGSMRVASADSAAMVEARDSFLRAGHYAPLARRLARLAGPLCPPGGTVLDAGTGTGYYLAALLEAAPGAAGLGLDASKYALRRAARAHPRAGAATWDVWEPLPVRDGTVDLLLNVFAPRNGPEFRRVLRPDASLVVVTPTAGHLAELRGRMGTLSVDTDKEERLRRTLADHFRPAHTESLEYALALPSQDVRNAVAMGPSSHHLGHDEAARRAGSLETPFEVTASFTLSVYRPR